MRRLSLPEVYRWCLSRSTRILCLMSSPMCSVWVWWSWEGISDGWSDRRHLPYGASTSMSWVGVMSMACCRSVLIWVCTVSRSSLDLHSWYYMQDWWVCLKTLPSVADLAWARIPPCLETHSFQGTFPCKTRARIFLRCVDLLPC